MRTKSGRLVLFAVVAVLSPLSAAARPLSSESLNQSVAALNIAGFAGLQNVAAPAAPAAPVIASRAADSTPQEALSGLVAMAQAQPESGGNIPETARALGFEFNGDFLVHSLGIVPTQDAKHNFSIASLRGETVIVIDVYSRATKELRSFRVSVSGTMQAAALTTKPNGSFMATPIPLPDADASRVFAAEIEFWTRYYRDHSGH